LLRNELMKIGQGGDSPLGPESKLVDPKLSRMLGRGLGATLVLVLELDDFDEPTATEKVAVTEA
jgi:hypothetical protein